MMYLMGMNNDNDIIFAEFGIDLTESERCFFDLTDDEEDE